MSTEYSCVVCGRDVDENAPCYYNEDFDYEMPHCYFCGEVVRQHSTKFDEFREAFEFTKLRFDMTPFKLGYYIQSVAYRVEPEVNAFRTFRCESINLRNSHVGFMNGGKACPTAEVPEQFERLMELWSPDFEESDVEMWIKYLLDIHPWADGNGRTASIVRNWMLGTMNNPTPLPYYYGEH